MADCHLPLLGRPSPTELAIVAKAWHHPPMATTLRMVLLDEIMLPGTASDVWLEPAEAAFIGGAGVDEDLEIPAVLVVCREPGATTPTALEQKVNGHPGATLDAALLASGVLFAQRDADAPPRLALAELTRVRVERIEAIAGGWTGTVSPWPYERSELSDVKALLQSFYSALLVTFAEGEGALQEQVEQPVKELESAEDDVTRLFLLADYLFDSPTARRSILEAPSTQMVQEMVSDALELIAEGLPRGPKAVRPGLLAYIEEASRTGLGQLQGIVTVLLALSPLLNPSDRERADLATLCTDITEVQDRFDALMTRLLTGRRR
jgi:hypothetical protein